MVTTNDLYFLDFDKLFENYADKYYNEHSADYESPDDFAHDLDKVYHIWATSPQDAIGGISPSEFFNRIPTEELPDILRGACIGDRNPSSLLFDRIATETTDEKLLTVTLSIIDELGGAGDKFYLDMIERDVDDAVKEMCVGALCERADRVKNELLDRAEHTDDVNMIEIYAEPLTFCKAGDDRILELLRMLLGIDPNTAYIAGLTARYGDERAAADLYALLDDCDYPTFLELRNAIETLGGSVDEHYRDFTDDPSYGILKGVK